eukprot:CAMPEP_0113881340 /NCGR_PEP_ID=MMETSP0780_2-20120614/8319_1 /TAXON_ID=652834 /ORGANISM="Palpitomonas bilix" /LENGTH=328 /DNA_ID=CAMNT_0000868181 /DNA_START=190 /DNA_END=1174 /DNA_ORIENTATION=+ /assembly_acc=CAM_ASM_000599
MAKKRIAQVVIAVLLCIAAAHVVSGRRERRRNMDKDALYLEDVDVLTFKHGEYTRGVRYSAEPVIKVSGGNARRHYDEVKDVQCENKGIGMDGDVNWRCSTDLPVGLKMSDANVVCEGYGGPESDAVLRGSCMVDLQLNYEGDAYRSQHGGGWGYTRGEQESSSIGSFIMTVIVLLIVGWIVYKMLEGCCKPHPATAVPPSYNPDYEPPTAYPVGGGVGAAAGAYAAGPNVTPLTSTLVHLSEDGEVEEEDFGMASCGAARQLVPPITTTARQATAAGRLVLALPPHHHRQLDARRRRQALHALHEGSYECEQEEVQVGGVKQNERGW